MCCLTWQFSIEDLHLKVNKPTTFQIVKPKAELLSRYMSNVLGCTFLSFLRRSTFNDQMTNWYINRHGLSKIRGSCKMSVYECFYALRHIQQKFSSIFLEACDGFYKVIRNIFQLQI